VNGLTRIVDGEVLFENVCFSLQKGQVLGIIGPNGSGKTTLLRMLVGDVKPDAGTIDVGSTGNVL